MLTNFHGLRFLILLIATLCLTSVLSNMNTYNFTKICIDTRSSHGNFTKSQKSWLQSSVAIGSLAASIPYTFAFQKFSHKYSFLSAGAISCVSTALVPWMDSLGYGWFFTARIFQGVAFSATFPLIGSITARWASLREHGVFIAFLTGNTQLSNIFTMPVSGWLCTSSWGWPAVYYVHSVLGLLVFFFFALIYTDDPEHHFLVTKKEIAIIEADKEETVEVSLDVPYRSIFGSLTLWAVWIAAFGDLIAVQLVSMFNPQYMKDYLHYDVLSTGFLAALPIIVQFAVKLTAGVTSDVIKCVSETAKVRIYNSIALAASALFFIALAFIPQRQHLLAIIFLVIAESLLGFNTAGFNKCATLHSRQYGHFVMTQIMNIWAVTILVEPFIVNNIVKENTYEDWRNCFLVHAALLLVVNVVFCVFADATPASWTAVRETTRC
ncbi:unnamed protein product [Caenorhabditis auriculariae]|uniref:Major facilitator superfamily (MFS) profile domain-containing protein n=1 Tax=Caenorhabditis auriculariae TaxID=2777116 RepID=A0A8S1GQH7_9PELO|nr:unnamed protein product [Caenorhabditis auriculariae]